VYDKAYYISVHLLVHRTRVIMSSAAVQKTQSAPFLFLTPDRTSIKLLQGHIKKDTFLVKLVYTM